MSEAVSALEKACFDLGFHRVEIRCSSKNVRSASVPEKCGYILEGKLKEDVFEMGDKRSTLIYGKLKHEAVSKRNDTSNFFSNVDLVRTFWQLFSNQKWDQAADRLHRDFIAVWPQSRERMIGAKNFIDVNRYYPGNHKIEVIHAFEVANKVLTTVWIEADTGQKTFANSIFEISDDKILMVEEYWAEPYAAPEWRKQWVESY
jgi:hypothetical protein